MTSFSELLLSLECLVSIIELFPVSLVEEHVLRVVLILSPVVLIPSPIALVPSAVYLIG